MGEETLASASVQTDDASVVSRAVAGDMAAFAILIRRYTPVLRAYARRMMNASDEVDDVVQEGFVIAWRRLADLDEPASVRSWLMRIVGRSAVARSRSRHPFVSADSVAVVSRADRSPAEVAETRGCLEALGEVLRELPDRQRESWVLREIGGYSYVEIARELGVPLSTARGLLSRARAQVMRRMHAWR